jgi:hypothetical protein
MLPQPGTYSNFTKFLRLPDADARLFWQAVWRSRWSESVALRQIFALRDWLVFDGMADGIASPHNLVKIIENLVREGVLMRQAATHLEERVLAATHTSGRWMTRGEIDRQMLTNVDMKGS